MWLRYLVTFLDILFCLILLSCLNGNQNKQARTGFIAMVSAYALSIWLMWN